MNATHLHLMLNHVSILAAAFALITYVSGFFRRNESVKKVALIGFIIAALAAIPVFLSGNEAEESVENLPGVLESIIDSHGEAAEISIWLIEITGIVALFQLFSSRIKILSTPIFGILLIILSTISSISISYTGYLGGKIRHTEINSSSIGQAAEQGESGEKDED